MLIQREAKVGALVSADRHLDSPVGWVAVLGAIILFGSSGIMFKVSQLKMSSQAIMLPTHKQAPSIVESPPDPVLFQAFNAIGIFGAAVPLIAYQLSQGGVHVNQVLYPTTQRP